MKKRYYIPVLAIGLIAVYLWTQRSMVSMQRNVSELEPLAAECGFALDAEDDVTIQLKSTIIEGDLKILLLDEANQTIKLFENNTSINEKILLNKGHYAIRVESDGFKGKYSVKVK